MAKHNEIGRIGEGIAARFLHSKGLKIVVRNYWKPYGEIDIVARETVEGANRVHFVEVKTVSYETDGEGDPTISHLPAGRQVEPGYRPEENMHYQKAKRLSRAIESYIISHGTGEWQFDVVCVYVDQKARKAKVRWIKDIILGA